MSQPPSFQITVIFQQEEANQVSGRGSVRTGALDALFSAVKSTIDTTLANLRLVQRDDGELLDGIVKIHTLAADVLSLIANGAFTVRGVWASTTAYAKGDIASNGGILYLCLEAHTSGTFAIDVAAMKWAQFFSAGTATTTSFATTSTITAGNVQEAIEELDSDLRTGINIYLHDYFKGI